MYKQFLSLKNKPVTWTKFNRKGYAIFMSLGKEIKIGVLAASTLMFANPEAISAQTTKTDDKKVDKVMNLEDVEVTATRVTLKMNQTARIVNVITKEQITESPAQTVNDLLKYEAGVDVRQRGPFGIQTDISINGGTHDQIVILINGVYFSSPHTGHLAADFPITIDDIDHIEILEGAASRVYGTSAFSGAINIVTKAKRENSINLTLQGGSYGTLGADASVSLNTNKVSNSVSASFNRSDGGTQNSDFEKYTAFYQGNTNGNKLADFKWQLGMSRMNYGANTFYSGKYPDQHESDRKYSAAIQAETKGTVKIMPTIYFSRSLDHYQLIKGTNTGENFHLTDVYGASVNTQFKWNNMVTSAGADFRNEGILSTALGKPLSEELYVKVRHHKGLTYNKKDNRTNICYFLEHDIILDKWTMSAGVMANMNTGLDYRYRLYPGFDISYRPNAFWKIYAAWNTAQRMPTFTDLYYKSPTQEGNQGLKPEKTQEFNVGTDFNNGTFRFAARGFYRKQKNMIDWILYPADSINNYTTYHAANFKINNMGVEVNSAVNLKKLANGKGPLEKLTVNYAYIYQDRKDDIEIYASSYALDYLRHKFNATLSMNLVSKLKAQISYRWQKRMGSYIKYITEEGSNNMTAQNCRYKPYGLIDMRLKWDENKYTIFLDANNITSYTYYDIGNVKQPGLWIMGGIKLNMGI